VTREAAEPTQSVWSQSPPVIQSPASGSSRIPRGAARTLAGSRLGPAPQRRHHHPAGWSELGLSDREPRSGVPSRSPTVRSSRSVPDSGTSGRLRGPSRLNGFRPTRLCCPASPTAPTSSTAASSSRRKPARCRPRKSSCGASRNTRRPEAWRWIHRRRLGPHALGRSAAPASRVDPIPSPRRTGIRESARRPRGAGQRGRDACRGCHQRHPHPSGGEILRDTRTAEPTGISRTGRSISFGASSPTRRPPSATRPSPAHWRTPHRSA